MNCTTWKARRDAVGLALRQIRGEGVWRIRLEIGDRSGRDAKARFRFPAGIIYLFS